MSHHTNAAAKRLLVLSRPCVDETFAVGPMPTPGHEVSARSRHLSPGGGAITAIAAQRLGLAAGIAHPPGTDIWGRMLTESLEHEGVMVPEPDPSRATASTVVLSTRDDRAMVNYDDDAPIDPTIVEAFAPGAIVCDLDQLPLLPAGTQAYVSCSDTTSGCCADQLGELGEHDTLIANHQEAQALTGLSHPLAAAHALARYVPRVVVTCGPDGAVAIIDGKEHQATPPRVDVVDTTGAGDISTATLAWAGFWDLPPAQALAWMTLHGALSVTVPTGVGGALPLERLIAEGRARKLTLPEL